MPLWATHGRFTTTIWALLQAILWPIRKLQPDWMSLDENMVAPVHLPINNLDGNLSGVNLNGHARIIMHKNSEIIRHANNHLTRVNWL